MTGRKATHSPSRFGDFRYQPPIVQIMKPLICRQVRRTLFLLEVLDRMPELQPLADYS